MADALTLSRRDLDAPGAPWAVVDRAHPDDVGDLWAQVTGTGHPVLWRVAGGERPEYVATGPWALTPPSGEDDVWSSEWLRDVPPFALAFACRALACELLFAMTPAVVRAFDALSDWWSGDDVDLVAPRGRINCALAATRKPKAVEAGLVVYGAIAAAARHDDRSEVFHRLGSARCSARMAVRGIDTRAVILRALGVRP